MREALNVLVKIEDTVRGIQHLWMGWRLRLLSDFDASWVMAIQVELGIC